MSSRLRIAAIFATLNRAATTVACVRSLAEQSRPPDLVVVADNVSSDNTVTALEDLHQLPFSIVVHRMPDNRGNAGGVEAAMDLAFEQGADAVWILDDDSWPRKNSLEELLSGSWNSDVVRHSIQIDPKTGAFTWPLQVEAQNGQQRLVYRLEDIPAGSSFKSKCMWTGSLVPRRVRDEVGRVNGGLFIRGEDEEYPWRISKMGFSFECYPSSILDHPGPENIVQWSFFGKHFFFEKGLADWKLYYKVRNKVWLALRQSGWLKAASSALIHLATAMWIDGLGRVPLVIEAARDGMIGRLGRWSKHPP